MKTLRGYSSPFNFGHKSLEVLFDGDVYIQEKVDGSQISFGKVDGEVFARSKNQELIMDVSLKSMFQKGIKTILDIGDLLIEGYTYRGEFLAKPKQNTLAYERAPKGNIILFDVDKGDQDYMLPAFLSGEAARIGLEAVDNYGCFKSKPDIERLKRFLENESTLGGANIEGVVLKNYEQFGRDKKILMAKYVSKEFVEKHSKDWKKRHTTNKEYVEQVIEDFRTEARWDKAIQHLAEDGKINGTVQDIGLLIREVSVDILKDNGEEIKERLFKHFWKQISRGVVRGLPEYYKNQLVERALEE